MHGNTTQLDKARQLYQAGSLESTMELLEPLVRKPPIDPRVLRLLFKVYAERHWIKHAERIYRKLLSLSLPESQIYALYLDMARVYHACGQATRSLKAIEKAIALNPSIREAYDLLVQVHESRNTLAEAAETLQHSVAQQPDNADLHSVLAKTYEKTGWWVEARDAAQTAIRLKPKMAEPQHILRRVKKRLKSNPRFFQEAAGRRQVAGDIEGMLHNWFAWAEATQEVDDFVAAGELCEQHGQLGRAEYAFNRALNLRRDHARAREGLRRVQSKKEPPVPLGRPIYDANELEQLYEWFIQCGDVAGVISFLRSYLVRHPDFVPALRFLARAYQEASKHDAATRTLQEAIDKSFDAAKANLYCELGAVYLAQGQKEKAKRAFRTALRHQRDHPEAKRQLAALFAAEVPPPHVLYEDWNQFRAVGRYEEALEYYQNFIDIDPFNPHPYILKSRAYEKLGRIDKAYQANKSAAFLIYRDDAFVKLGEFCARRGLYAEAAEAFELALKINKRNVAARRGLAQIPRWMTSEKERLRSRTDKPDRQYLYAIWKLSRQKSRVNEAVKYFAALADVMVNEPILFSLLGQANEAYGDPRTAAVAYRHKAALQETAKEYVKLGDFCFRHPGLDVMAVEAYQTALELNPFYYHAKSRLAHLRPSRFSSPAFITGNNYREDLARDLCETPGDHVKAEKLRTQFAESGAVKYAEATYRLLQGYHPEQPAFVQDLTQIYLACGKRQPLAEPAPPESPVESLAPTIAIEWYMHRTTVAATQEVPSASPAESVQAAQEHLHEARGASVDDAAQLRHLLAAASLYRRAEQPDHTLDCLVSYGQAIAHYHRARGKTNLARDFAIEAMWLAVSRVANVPERQAALASYILDYLEDLEKGEGPPQAWPATVHVEFQALLAAARSLASPRLGNLLSLIESFLIATQQPTTDQDFKGPVHRAAVVQRRVGTILRPREQERLSAALEHWITDLAKQKKRTIDRTQLELSFPWILSLSPSTSELDLEVTVRNVGNTPADSVWVTLSVGSGAKVREPRQFIPFLPGGVTYVVTFHLTDIPEQPGYVELRVDLGYFDPVDLQETTTHAVPTLQRPDRPFQPLDNPYYVSWSPPRQFKPGYLSREQAQRLLVDGAQDIGVEWTPGALSQALDLTAGEAVTLETLGRQVVVYLNEIERTPPVVLPLDVEAAAEAMVAQRDGCSHFVALIDGDQLSAVDKLILACLAARADNYTTWARQDDLLRDLDRWGSRILTEVFLGRASRLQTRIPLIEAEETLDGSYRYRLVMKLLHTWLRRHWLPGHAFANLRQFQREERSRLVSKLREKLAEAKGEYQAYRKAEDAYKKGLIDIGRFTQLTQTHIGARDALLFEIKGILTNEEYADAREVLDKMVASESDQAIREALKAAARRRGWEEVQVRQRLSSGRGDILDQVAHFVLDVWEA